jgi:hypothetical protein
MQLVENVTVVGRSLGEHNVVVVLDENTGKEISLFNLKGIELELGMEGKILVAENPIKSLESFEPVLAEEIA